LGEKFKAHRARAVLGGAKTARVLQGKADGQEDPKKSRLCCLVGKKSRRTRGGFACRTKRDKTVRRKGLLY